MEATRGSSSLLSVVDVGVVSVGEEEDDEVPVPAPVVDLSVTGGSGTGGTVADASFGRTLWKNSSRYNGIRQKVRLG